jgi:hypothetical protein
MSSKNQVGVTVFQSVKYSLKDGFNKSLVTSCLAAVLSIGVFSSSVAMADEAGNKRKDERLGGFTLEDGSMLGRYGDVNDEWVPAARVQISSNEMTEQRSRKAPKKDNRLGAYSTQDDAMLGPYGDKNDE